MTAAVRLTALSIRILSQLADHPAHDIATLASEIGKQRASVSRAIPSLEMQGWVKHNGRAVSITDEGRNIVRHKQAAYMRSIEPYLEKARKYAELYHIPLLIIVELDGLLYAKTNELDACSELHCAYHEAMGWEED